MAPSETQTSLTWLQKHERIVLGLALLVVSLFLLNKYLDKSYDSAVARNQAAQAVLQDQVSKNSELQKNVDSLQQKYGQLLGTLTRQNQTLVAAVAARNQVVVGQQKQDAGLVAPELAARHETLIGIKGVQSTENGFLVIPPVELQTVQSLETLPVLQQNLKDEQQLSANKDQQIASLDGVVAGLDGQVSGLKLQITDGQKSCDARIAVAKKSRWKFFKAGAVVGFVAGVLTRHYL
jgi:hypothetical protein